MVFCTDKCVVHAKWDVPHLLFMMFLSYFISLLIPRNLMACELNPK